MTQKIKVAILDDHQSIIDGYKYRLSISSEIEVVAEAYTGEDLEPLLDRVPVDVLILDISVPTSKTNSSPYPILYLIPKLLDTYPDLSILVISMHDQRTIIHAVLEAGASGYILKDDQPMIQNLASAVRSIANGGVCFSRSLSDLLLDNTTENQTLTARQAEVLSLLVAYPDLTTADTAQRLNVAHSTVRNLLSAAYLRLGVRNRAAAILEARRLGLVTPDELPPEIKLYRFN